MNRAREAAFAWEIATAASNLLRRQQFNQMCVTLGAGEYTDAIESSLKAFANAQTPFPIELTGLAIDWLAGYRGTAEEPRLRALLEDARVRSSA